MTESGGGWREGGLHTVDLEICFFCFFVMKKIGWKGSEFRLERSPTVEFK